MSDDVAQRQPEEQQPDGNPCGGRIVAAGVVGNQPKEQR